MLASRQRGRAESVDDQTAVAVAGKGRRPIRVALVDDHHLVREGLRLVLSAEDDIVVAGEAAGPSEALELLRESAPDVILLDLTLGGMDGIPLLRALKALNDQVRIVVVTMHQDPETVRQALMAGASAYLVKGAFSAEVVAAIRAVMRNERYLHSSVTGIVVDDSVRWLRTGQPLSPREREVIGLVASGESLAEIGHALGISRHTVRRHVANVSGKLGLKGVAALTRYAVRQGLVRTSS
jgi:DNA-binding NarL/FixJ family response regulator